MEMIKIVAVPQGQAPEWVRKAWVGVVMRVAQNVPSGFPLISLFLQVLETGILDNKPVKGCHTGYHVEKEVALRTLEEKNPEAAQWFRDNFYMPEEIKWLFFEGNVCQVI